MHTSEIQIVFYGQNISGLQIETDSPLVIKSVLKTDNPNYIFAIVETQNAAASTYTFRFKKDGKIAQEINYPILKREPDSRWRKSFWQIHPRIHRQPEPEQPSFSTGERLHL